MDTDTQTTDSKPRHSGMFQPGQSGNPSGRPKSDVTIRELAKGYTEEAIQTLAEIMQNPKATHTARANAACALLDRAWGKPSQHIENVNRGQSYTEWLDEHVNDLADYCVSTNDTATSQAMGASGVDDLVFEL